MQGKTKNMEDIIRSLVTEIETYLSDLEGAGIATVLGGINKCARGPVGPM
jgi:hypothetical protein